MPRILMVASKGGHFQELRRLSELEGDHPVFYLLESDGSTQEFARANPGKVWLLRSGGRQDGFGYYPRFLMNAFVSVVYLIWTRPQVVLSTGAHTAVVPLLVAGLFGVRTVYLESFARVTSLSLTGRILRGKVSLFLCQHSELAASQTGVIYRGALY